MEHMPIYPGQRSQAIPALPKRASGRQASGLARTRSGYACRTQVAAACGMIRMPSCMRSCCLLLAWLLAWAACLGCRRCFSCCAALPPCWLLAARLLACLLLLLQCPPTNLPPPGGACRWAADVRRTSPWSGSRSRTLPDSLASLFLSCLRMESGSGEH